MQGRGKQQYWASGGSENLNQSSTEEENKAAFASPARDDTSPLSPLSGFNLQYHQKLGSAQAENDMISANEQQQKIFQAYYMQQQQQQQHQQQLLQQMLMQNGGSDVFQQLFRLTHQQQQQQRPP
mmetsp:Transcript_11875/g.21193  ORF Transcript_11875/g.21193 Transcript_11875/m.21193 type:complete len:125 (-) Transcript_11875:471-845(-)